MTSNQLKFAELQESRRHNVVGENETQRHNVAQESIGLSQAAAAHRQASASASQAAAAHRQAGAAESQAATRLFESKWQRDQGWAKIDQGDTDLGIKQQQADTQQQDVEQKGSRTESQNKRDTVQNRKDTVQTFFNSLKIMSDIGNNTVGTGIKALDAFIPF